MQAFQNFKPSTDDILQLYQLIKGVVCEFNGDAEKFFPQFYECFAVSESPFQMLEKKL